MTRVIYVDEAEQARVSATVAAVVRDLGGVVDTHTPSVVEFEHVNPAGAYGFSRSGYVGIYQRFGEKSLELLIDVFAVSPRRLFWTSVALELLLIVLIFALGPPTSVWFLAAIGLWAWFVVVALIYVGTWYQSRRLELDIFDRVRREVGRTTRVLTPMEIEEQDLRTRVLSKVRIDELKREVRERRRGAALDLFRPSRPAKTDAEASDASREGERSGKSRFAIAVPKLSLPKISFPRRQEPAPEEAAAEDSEAKRKRLDELKRRLSEKREND